MAGAATWGKGERGPPWHLQGKMTNGTTAQRRNGPGRNESPSDRPNGRPKAFNTKMDGLPEVADPTMDLLPVFDLDLALRRRWAELFPQGRAAGYNRTRINGQDRPKGPWETGGTAA